VAPGTLEAAAAQAGLQPVCKSSQRRDGPCGVAGGQPFWRRTALQADKRKNMGATEYEVRAIRFGILDLPSIP
jgi:hypothetical protein